MVIQKSTTETRGFKRSNGSYLFALRYTLIPTSLILGLGGAPLWSAKCTYLTISGNAQAAAEGKRSSDIISQYFGVFFFLFQSSAVWGNLMSSLIFGQDTKIGANLGREGRCHHGNVPNPISIPTQNTASLGVTPSNPPRCVPDLQDCHPVRRSEGFRGQEAINRTTAADYRCIKITKRLL